MSEAAASDGIIGGLYAAGYSSVQIDNLVIQIDFLRVLFQEKKITLLPLSLKRNIGRNI